MATPTANIPLQQIPPTAPPPPSTISSAHQQATAVLSSACNSQNSAPGLSASNFSPLPVNYTSNANVNADSNTSHPSSSASFAVKSLLKAMVHRCTRLRFRDCIVPLVKCVFATGAMIIAVLALYQSFWSSAKDYRDDCRSVNETYGYTSPDCATVLKESLRRPWGLGIFVSKSEGEGQRFQQRDEVHRHSRMTDRIYDLNSSHLIFGVIFLLLAYLAPVLGSWYHRPQGFPTGPWNDYLTSRAVPTTTGLYKGQIGRQRDKSADMEPDWSPSEDLKALPTTICTGNLQRFSLHDDASSELAFEDGLPFAEDDLASVESELEDDDGNRSTKVPDPWYDDTISEAPSSIIDSYEPLLVETSVGATNIRRRV